MGMDVMWKGLVFMALEAQVTTSSILSPPKCFLNKSISSSYCLLLILELYVTVQRKKCSAIFEGVSTAIMLL